MCASGLLLQYHAPLADELLCSSLVPLSPNQACHNMSQCGHKWGKTPLAIRSITYLTPSVKLHPVRCVRRPKNRREKGRAGWRDACRGRRRGDRRRLRRSWGGEQTVGGRADMSFHSPLFLRGLESGACSVLMFVISPSPRCYCSAYQQAWHRLTHGLLSYGAGTVARLQLLGGYHYLCFFVSLRDPASLLPPPPPPPPPIRVLPFFLHSSVSFSSLCCFFLPLSRTLSPTFFFCHPFLCVSLPHLLSSHRPPSHISLSRTLWLLPLRLWLPWRQLCAAETSKSPIHPGSLPCF